MTTLSIKDVPESWAEELRQRAARNHRSLQGELLAIVESALGHAPHPEAMRSSGGDGRIVGYDRRGWPIVRQGNRTAEEVIAEMKARGLINVIPGQPLAVDILRHDRDTR